jgi:RimJ/RimL family protein N-acetyltransferase
MNQNQNENLLQNEISVKYILKNKQEIVIRTAQSTDLEAVWTGLSSQPESFYNFIPLVTRKLVENWYSKIDLNKVHPLNCFFWDSKNNCEGKYVGNLTIEFIQDKRFMHVAKLGIHILTEFQRMGIATAFGNILKTKLMIQSRIKKVMVEVVGINNKSLNLVKKFGFQEEGCLKRYWNNENQFYDVYLLSINI